jgi:hypothetical protein
MPFFLVYGAEAVIPLEVTMVSHRVQAYDKATQDDMMMSMKEDDKQLSEMYGTARRSDATTSGLCIVGSSRWTI